MTRTKWLRVWDVCSITVLHVNSFLLLLLKVHREDPMAYVIYAATASDCLAFSLEAILLRHDHPRRWRVMDRTKWAYKIVYILLYATLIHIERITPGASGQIGQNIGSFCYLIGMFAYLLASVPLQLAIRRWWNRRRMASHVGDADSARINRKHKQSAQAGGLFAYLPEMDRTDNARAFLG